MERLPAFFALRDGAGVRFVVLAARFFARFARAAAFGRAAAFFAADAARVAGADPAVFAGARAGAFARPDGSTPLAFTSTGASAGSALLRRFGACAR